MSVLSEIQSDVAAIKAENRTRWDAHDKRSTENWARINSSTSRIEEFMSTAAVRKNICMNEMKKETARYVGLWFGVPITLTSIIGLIILIIKVFHV